MTAAPPTRCQPECAQVAREIVTDWLGAFDPPPQIDSQQSEMLQAAIVSALRAESARCDAEIAEVDEALKAFGRATTQTNIDYPQRLEAILTVEKFLQKRRRALASPPSEAGREEIIEKCAKIADQVAINAERRAAGHTPQSQAEEAALNKMEGAKEVASQIRSRALSPDQGTVAGSPDHPGSDTSSGHPSAENDAT